MNGSIDSDINNINNNINNNSTHSFTFNPGDTPLLVSMPHSGLLLTPAVAHGLTTKAQKLPDTDWHIPQLYNFLAPLGVGCIQANYSRYVIDLNRPVNDKPLYQTKTTGLFPEVLFDESDIFQESKRPTSAHKKYAKKYIWQAYHTQIKQELARLKAKFGYAILFDAHSIAPKVPMLFEGTLPDFNWGNNAGLSCDCALLQALENTIAPHYTQVSNGRFKGGYITRHFGQPQQGIHAIQLELSQATYLNDLQATHNNYQLDANKLPIIKQQLKAIIQACLLVVPSLAAKIP
ncbi:N-formylglutamate deformylase [Marinagarivorans algicola]|uniref:N-formylglutamate deformylase n=1 Tax=Marinagarivorans algicola TaxID=1513270 RepID=UPI0009E8E644|nr:N-formylglutamate deformylase [Marinagarivorans algicola]